QWCSSHPSDDEPQYNFHVLYPQNEDKDQGCKIGHKKLCCIHGADGVTRTFTFAQYIRGHNRSPTATANGIEQSAYKSQKRSAFHFLRFYFLAAQSLI